MSNFINRQTGALSDFIPRPGDAPPPGGRSGSAADRWGARSLISNDPLLKNSGTKQKVTLIDTGDLGRPRPINVQMRFAVNFQQPAGFTPIPPVVVPPLPPSIAIFQPQPIMPFLYTVPGSVVQLQVSIKRGVDPLTPPTVDTYLMGPADVLPVDTITARLLVVEVEVMDVGSGGTVWVESVASPVADIGARNQYHPWEVSQNPDFFPATVVGATSVLAPNSDRVQFFLCNTSTDADCMIQLGRGPNLALPQWLPTPRGTFVLPRGMFSVYESVSPSGFKGIPTNAVRGAVYAIWSNVGTGGLMFHEGTAF